MWKKLRSISEENKLTKYLKTLIIFYQFQLVDNFSPCIFPKHLIFIFLHTNCFCQLLFFLRWLIFLVRHFVFCAINFSLLCFWQLSLHLFCSSEFSFTGGVFWWHLEFYRIRHKPRRYLVIFIKKFWYLSWTIFDDI